MDNKNDCFAELVNFCKQAIRKFQDTVDDIDALKATGKTMYKSLNCESERNFIARGNEILRRATGGQP